MWFDEHILPSICPTDSPFLPRSFLFSFPLNNFSLLSFNIHIHDFNSSYVAMKDQLRNKQNIPTNEPLNVFNGLL